MPIIEHTAVEKARCLRCKGSGEFNGGISSGLETVDCGQCYGFGYVYRALRGPDVDRTNLYVGLKVAANYQQPSTRAVEPLNPN